MRRITVVGHAYSTIGVAEMTRACIRSLQALSYDVRFFDVYKCHERTDPAHRALLEPIEIDQLEDDIRVFHINGDEVEPALAHLRALGQAVDGGYNIILPAWELPKFPHVWRDGVASFDRIWACSYFMQDSLAASGLDSDHVGNATEFSIQPFLSRRCFGIRESAFAVLNFSDESSYPARKNSQGVVNVYDRLRRERPYDDIQLVMKVKSGEGNASPFLQTVHDRVPDAALVGRRLSDFEMRSLMWSSDCFVSLHRSEGYGRGPAEAMFMGRAAMATGWSGNMDYMTPESSFIVPYELVTVGADEYPEAMGQHWAEPDEDAALFLLKRMMDDPAETRSIARQGRRRAMQVCTNRAMGARMDASLSGISFNVDY